jgi:hypothetical protein
VRGARLYTRLRSAPVLVVVAAAAPRLATVLVVVAAAAPVVVVAAAPALRRGCRRPSMWLHAPRA